MSPVLPSDFKAVISDPTATLCGNFVNTLLRLPTLIFSFVSWIINSDGELSDAFKVALGAVAAPPGTLRFSAAPAGVEDGWLLCAGQAVSRTTYAALYAKLGTVWGTGDGSSTFNLPDGRGRFLLSTGTLPSGASPALGTVGGEEKHALTEAELASHTHGFRASVDENTGGGADGWGYAAKEGFTSDRANVQTIAAGSTGFLGEVGGTYPVSNAGSGTAHNNMPPYLPSTLWIKT